MAALRAVCFLLLALVFLNVWCEESQGNAAASNNSSSSNSSTGNLFEEARREMEEVFNPEIGRQLIKNLTSQLADLGSQLGNLSHRLEAARDRAARVLQESIAQS